MKKYILILLCLGIQTFAFSQSLEEFIREGVNFSEKGEFDKSVSVYDRALEKYPSKPILYVLKAESIAKRPNNLSANENTYDKAMTEFDKALKLDSLFYPVYHSRALISLYYQKYDQAIQDFTNVMKYGPQDLQNQFTALADRGAAKSYSKDFEGAIEDYKAALELNPQAGSLYTNIGMLYSNMEEYDLAKEALQKAMALDDSDPLLLNNYAFLYLKLDSVETAIKYIKRGLEIDPKEPFLINNMGLAKVKLGEAKEGIALINKSLEIYPENSYAYKYRAIAYIALRKKKKACEDLEKANELGYSISYDNEVNELIEANCKK